MRREAVFILTRSQPNMLGQGGEGAEAWSRHREQLHVASSQDRAWVIGETAQGPLWRWGRGGVQRGREKAGEMGFVLYLSELGVCFHLQEEPSLEVMI